MRCDDPVDAGMTLTCSKHYCEGTEMSGVSEGLLRRTVRECAITKQSLNHGTFEKCKVLHKTY